MHTLKRRLAKYSRWLHIYVSMTSFVIVLFFAVTGWTLNHPAAFAGHERRTNVAGTLDPKLAAAGSTEVARLEIVEALRAAHRVGGALSDFRIDEEQVSVAFKGPGYIADAVIDRRTGKYELTESRLGLIAIANDLHKGRDSGEVWKALIDVSAGLLTFISLTGLVLLYFIHKHRVAGFVLLLAGGAVTGAIIWAWVP
ncbi:MAG TPA: PepSY-associated TM helix domain-containing protein [Vicinamibacterales bacterium]|nr:PepSY-associated TM helix domain-containing protein [Vicinamibacterales bacterium]